MIKIKIPGLAFLCPVIVTFLFCFFLVFGSHILSRQPFFFFLFFFCFNPSPILDASSPLPSLSLLHRGYSASDGLILSHPAPHVAGRWRDRDTMIGTKITEHPPEAKLTPLTHVFSVFWLSAWEGLRKQPEWWVWLHCVNRRV